MSEDSLQRAMNAPIGTVYRSPVPDCESVQGLFGNAAFWIGGAVCVGLWSWLIYYAIWGLR